MKIFKTFPQDDVCPVCGNNDNTECMLVAVGGTGDGHTIEAVLVHIDCINLTIVATNPGYAMISNVFDGRYYDA